MQTCAAFFDMDAKLAQVAVAGIRMMRPLVTRAVGYMLSAVVASAFYVLWIAALPIGRGRLSDHLLAGSFLYLMEGLPLTLLLMALPWTMVVWTWPKVPLSGVAYFASAGAFLMLLMGCVASSLSPKLLFIEDQTFLQGFVIALERQGVCLAIMGAIIGLGYWFSAERSPSRERVPVAVGTTIADRPLRRSVRARLRIRLL
jgi:hypothetical protein